MTNKKIAYYILIVGFVLSLFMHLNIFKTDLIGVHLWRQSQTQWNINNFVDQDFNILNPRTASFNQGKDNIYRYEFPVMQWLVACFIKIFGNNILVTRISMFLLGLFTCFGLFTLFRQVTQDYIISSLATFAFCFSPIFYYYTMNPLPDNMALCCATWYLVYIMKLKDNINWKNIFISAFFLLIATLSKLPYIIFGASLLVVLSKRDNFHVAFKTLLIYALILFPALLWYVWVIPGWNGNGIINGIINSPVTIGRGVDILIYHFHEMFPHHLMNTASTILFLFAVYFAFKEKLFRSYPFQILLASYIMCIFYFLFEFPMIEMIHDYYMMPFLPLLFAGVCFGLKKA
ncbi:MAG TPA: glycosyltransferase family 39 protein, partial [Saprospiraceae bacterium]|nr:glycosyltransferase family 39 protein [Saprospiraceae bacterium]